MANQQHVKLARVQGIREAVKLYRLYTSQGVSSTKALEDITRHANLLEDCA